LKPLLFSMTMLISTLALAGTDNFDIGPPGAAPYGWSCGVTGRGSPVWKVESDPAAPSKPNVLKQSGSGIFPWCVIQNVSIADGFVEVRFKPLAGNEDQAGGIVWRWKDSNNYYVARANALEDNVTIYHTIEGSRRQFENVNMKVAPNQWHSLRVEFVGNRFKVLLDGRLVLEASDDAFKDAGAVGVWTKADSVTAFDDFSYAESK